MQKTKAFAFASGFAFGSAFALAGSYTLGLKFAGPLAIARTWELAGADDGRHVSGTVDECQACTMIRDHARAGLTMPGHCPRHTCKVDYGRLPDCPDTEREHMFDSPH